MDGEHKIYPITVKEPEKILAQNNYSYQEIEALKKEFTKKIIKYYSQKLNQIETQLKTIVRNNQKQMNDLYYISRDIVNDYYDELKYLDFSYVDKEKVKHISKIQTFFITFIKLVNLLRKLENRPIWEIINNPVELVIDAEID